MMVFVRRASGLARRWWPQGCAVMLGLCGGLLYNTLSVPSYSAQAHVVVVANDRSVPEQTTSFAQAYTRIATQPTVIRAALRPELPAKTVSQLQRSMRVSTSPDAPLIGLSVSAPRADQAAAQANALAQALISYAATHVKDTGVRIASLTPAMPPEEQAGLEGWLIVVVGGAAGLLLGALYYLISPPRRTSGPKGSPGRTGESPRARPAKRTVQA
ncbi:lipopolysaccharide biosynthesis protein [Nonomuraea soli]|uniref:Uncharacterized protein involved in exopolysaccharide biosynthesis n=1 Tax=Nonomuraea soli TaxID=1032476 RepID=A0A7W0HQ93_9ACTN|nr:lipopolysaccharide biosynthesis protein [Nonomuraea soli]MBA2891401.1 uncharacterized protein involved in exopolysaccharide biosynthesis [Nonomuraea soli]